MQLYYLTNNKIKHGNFFIKNIAMIHFSSFKLLQKQMSFACFFLSPK